MQRRSTSTVFSCVLLAALALQPALGQRSTPVVRADRTLTGIPASIIDTDQIVPRIDSRFLYHPMRPENPIEPPAAGRDNGLRAGQLIGVPRGNLDAFWPAIGATGWTPPDPDLAVGPNHIVVTVNSSLAFFTKAGVNQFQQTAQTFFSGMGAGSFLFDPKCFYDRVNQRFVVLFVEEDDATQTSKILLAVSDDGDPNGIWYRYRIEAKLVISGSGYWLDYPGLGYNKDAYVVCGNMFGFISGFAGVQFLVIPSAPLLSGGAASVTSIRDAAGSSAQVCEMIDPTEARVYSIRRSGTTALVVYALQNLTTSPTLSSASVTVPSFSTPARAAFSTSGRTLDALDGRVFTANWRGGKLMTAHTIQSGTLRSRWYEVNTNNWPTSGSPTLSQSGDVANATDDYHMAAINRNSAGATSVIFTRSSTSITADIMFAGRASGDPAGTMGLPNLLESSVGNNYSQGRWGDYFGCDVDPVDDTTFWGVGMDVASTNNWRTSVFSWTIGGGPPPPPGAEEVSPSSFAMVQGSLVSGGVAQLATSNDDRLVTAPSGGIVQFTVDGTTTKLTPSQLEFIVEGQTSKGGVTQTLELFVHSNGTWEQVDVRTASSGSDGTVGLTFTSNPGRFVNSTTGLIRARITLSKTRGGASWQGKTDYVHWRVTP